MTKEQDIKARQIIVDTLNVDARMAQRVLNKLHKLGYRLPVKHTKKVNSIAIYTKISPVIKDGKFVDETKSFEVRVIATADGYVMVRRKGCMPFVCDEKELTYPSRQG